MIIIASKFKPKSSGTILSRFYWQILFNILGKLSEGQVSVWPTLGEVFLSLAEGREGERVSEKMIFFAMFTIRIHQLHQIQQVAWVQVPHR